MIKNTVHALLLFTMMVLFHQQGHSENIPYVMFDDLASTFTNEEQHTLRNGKSLSVTSSSKTLRYLPNIPKMKVIQERINDIRPTILYETLFMVPSKDPNIQTKQILKIYNLLRNISILTEIEYKNLKDENIHPIFRSSMRIADTVTKTVLLPFPNLGQLTQPLMEEASYVLQDMPPFGEVLSIYEYEYNPTLLSFIGSNESYVSYSGFKVVKPDNMLTTCWIVRTNEGIVIYGLGAVRVSGFAILFGDTISNSFISRMIGLFDWVNAQINNPNNTQNNNLLSN